MSYFTHRSHPQISVFLLMMGLGLLTSLTTGCGTTKCADCGRLPGDSDIPLGDRDEALLDGPGDMPDANEEVGIDDPADQGNDVSIDDPSEISGDDPADLPSDDPADIPGDPPGDDPTDLPGDDPADPPSDMPADTPADQPGDTPEIPDIPNDGSLALSSVEPRQGGCSGATPVVLRGAGFTAGLKVFVGDVEGTDVRVLSATEMQATFPPIPFTERGTKTVRVRHPEGHEARLDNAFQYIFDADPIVFVHGLYGNPTNWTSMVQRFKNLGYPDDHIAAIGYSNPATGSNVAQARDELAPFVDQVLRRTGKDRVDMVVHSMGGVSSRAYIKLFGGGDKVRDYVSLCSTHHGNNGACFTPQLGAPYRELCPTHAEGGQAPNGILWKLNGDPVLDDVDETPFDDNGQGPIHYTAILCERDTVVVPKESSCLNWRRANDCSDPVNVRLDVEHINAPSTPVVQDLVIQRVLSHDAFRP